MTMADHARSTEPGGPPPNLESWSRDGFTGETAAVIRPHYTPDYISVEGPHAPHRLDIHMVAAPDRGDPEALPQVIAETRTGVKLAVSARTKRMPYVVRNVEADEIHFIQEGALRFETDFGVLDAGAGDFVAIPRAVGHRIAPLETPTLSLIVESPWSVRLDTPAPHGMINLARDLRRTRIESPAPSGGETTLLIKTRDGVTRYLKPHDPLAAVAQAAGASPVWAINLARIAPMTYVPHGGPPGHFALSRNKEVLFYTLSARPGGRPPIHDNADYDELIFYVRGPGAWGKVSEPGTLTWVPKGVSHHGPPEDVPEGYLAWLLETADTLRLTPAGLAVAELMETGFYGRHPTARRR
jgi:homogentisate 1,2-dioxygenase